MFASTLCFAQVEDPNVMIIHYQDGSSRQIAIDEIDHLEFAKVDNPTTDPTTPTPKVGDYFYSDGTWSDGGLLSINDDGTEAKWAEPRPAPLADKTVIGIVFTTNPDRIAEADKEAGFTHGYVIGCKNITDPKKANYERYPETVWYGADGYAVIDVINVSKTAKTCYENINGRAETEKILEENDPQYYYYDVPMFYYGTTEYPVVAPENTSGWFIPSIGQMWDCVANFCSGDVAEYLASIRTKTSDFTYSAKKDLSSAPFEQFMKVFELVPAADKDEMTIPDWENKTAGEAAFSLGTSSRYDGESRVIINLGTGTTTLVEGMAGWLDEETHARPILAF